jgi:hypothetical protein
MQFVLDSFAFQINRAGWRDVRAIWELERAAFDRDAYGLLTLLAMSFAPRASWLKAVADGRLVGFVAGERGDRNGHAWIVMLAVHPRLPRARHRHGAVACGGARPPSALRAADRAAEQCAGNRAVSPLRLPLDRHLSALLP